MRGRRHGGGFAGMQTQNVFVNHKKSSVSIALKCTERENVAERKKTTTKVARENHSGQTGFDATT